MRNKLSVCDGLTGLHNRCHFDAAPKTEGRRAARNLKPISLLIIDIKYFKALNNEYGHQRGDDCLGGRARVLIAIPVPAARPPSVPSTPGSGRKSSRQSR
jgi:diguanylate cyclase (GGDEF)-like protein